MESHTEADSNKLQQNQGNLITWKKNFILKLVLLKNRISVSLPSSKPAPFYLLFSCCHSLCLSITFLHSLLSSTFPSPSPPPMHPSHLSHYTCSLSLPSLNGFQVVIQPLMERAFESSRGPSAPFTALAAAKSGSVVEDDLSLLEGEWESGS